MKMSDKLTFEDFHRLVTLLNKWGRLMEASGNIYFGA